MSLDPTKQIDTLEDLYAPDGHRLTHQERMDKLFDRESLSKKYPTLFAFTDQLPQPNREIVGRDKEINRVLAALCRPELCNVLLLAPAGSGKTALVQGTMLKDNRRLYLEVDLPRMISEVQNPAVELAPRLKALFDEASAFGKAGAGELVLFIDEFHQVVDLSSAAVEALKPILAASGARGIKLITATTYEEYNQFLKPNQPLIERLQPIKLEPADKPTTMMILRGFSKRYEVEDFFYDDHIFSKIHDYTDLYLPSSYQPRKSIRILDAMVGEHRYSGRPIDEKLMCDVFEETLGMRIAASVDSTNIKDFLDSRVYDQDFATQIIEERLHLSLAGLNDRSKPMGSFLFVGPTGVGKTEITKALAEKIFGDAHRHFIRFDMSEYANPDSLDLFRQELTDRVSDSGHSIVLLDEIEKSDARIIKLMLQLLDDGRMSDRYGRQVSFRNCYIVLTSNAGSSAFKEISSQLPSDATSADIIKEFGKIIQREISNYPGNKFPPEFIGRVDCLVPFKPLSPSTINRIVWLKLSKVRSNVWDTHRVDLRVNRDVLSYLVDENMDMDTDSSGGARGALKRVNQEFTTKVARFINENPGVKVIGAKISGEMAVNDPTLRQGNAHIEIFRVSGSRYSH